jgi:chromosome segregation ATPase
MTKNLQDFRNDILAGKKLFSLFERMEEAVNVLAEKESRAAELQGVLSQREELLTKTDIAIANAQRDLDKIRAECKDLRAKSDADLKKSAEKAQEAAKNKADELAQAIQKQKQTLQDLKDQCSQQAAVHSDLKKTIQQTSAELENIIAKIKKAKQEVADLPEE